MTTQTPKRTAGTKPFHPEPIIATIVVLLVVAAFFALFLWHNSRADKRARAEFIALQQTRNAAREQVDRIDKQVREAERLAAEARQKLAVATNDLFFVLGRGLNDPPAQPRSPAQAMPAMPRPTPPGTPAQDEATEPAQRKGLDLMTPEELEARHRRAQTRQSAMLDETGQPSAPAGKPGTAPSPEPVAMRMRPGLKQPDPEILVAARTLDEDTRTLLDAATSLDSIRGEAQRSLTSTLAAESSVEAAKKASILPELLPEAERLHTKVLNMRRSINTTAERIVRIRIETAEAREKQRQEEKRLQQEAEQADTVRREQQLATSAWIKCRKEHLRDNAFAAAADYLKSHLAGMKTEAGKAAFQHVLSRYERLAELKQYLVASINKKPFKWGWGAPGQARDILRADDIAVVTTRGKVLWAEADAAQMLRLLNHYVTRAEERTWEMAGYNLAAAILCDEYGMIEAREAFIDRAINLRDSTRNDVKTLFRMPPIRPPASEPETE
jgi:hypothetical protein